jgi:membrane protease YdiL (CAAX protease family)
MDQTTAGAFVYLFVALTWAGSIATWIGLASRRKRGLAILEHEPRSPVPWGGLAAALPVFYVALVLLPSIAYEPAPPDTHADASDAVVNLVATIVSQPLMVSCILLIVAALSGATARDLGLPSSLPQLARDIKIGFLAFLAALAPAQGVQIALLLLLGMKDAPGHPIFQMVNEGGPNVLVLSLATVLAVIVAPLSEEILFRLLLQGWLEKAEDARVGWRRTEVAGDEMEEAAVVLTPVGGASSPDNALAMPPLVDVEDHSETSPEPPRRGFAGLPYGWAPILASSFVFAIAHAGYGPEPVAIFVLALILGYVYQRTHRIVPTMVAHALFNAFAMVILWQLSFAKGR